MKLIFEGPKIAATCLAVVFLLALNASAQKPALAPSPGDTIRSVAGAGTATFSGDNGPAIGAAVARPFAMAADAAGNILIADAGNHRVRRIDTLGMISTVAGNGEQGYFGDNGPATLASLDTPTAVAIDSSGNIYIADSGNHRVRVVSNGTITTFAGNGVAGFSGDGGMATSASLHRPRGVAVDNTGRVYIADTKNHVVRMVSSGSISTIAGIAEQGFFGDNGPATAAALDTPTSVAVDASLNIYIADSHNHRIRKLSAGTITTFAGNGLAGFSGDGGLATAAAIALPLGVAVDNSGAVLIADSNNHVVRQVNAAGVIGTVTANGEQGFFGDNGPPAAASLDTPSGVLPLNGAIFIADKNNQRIRRTGPPPVILAPGYELLAPAVPAPVIGNRSANFLVTIKPLGGFTGQVSLNCTTVPQFVFCSLSPSTLNIGGGQANSTLTIGNACAGRSVALNSPALQIPLQAGWPVGLAGFVGIILLLERFRRGICRHQLIWGTMFLFMVLAICGCGGIESGTVNVTVIATSSSGTGQTGMRQTSFNVLTRCNRDRDDN
jgi:hypothetical protein